MWLVRPFYSKNTRYNFLWVLKGWPFYDSSNHWYQVVANSNEASDLKKRQRINVSHSRNILVSKSITLVLSHISLISHILGFVRVVRFSSIWLPIHIEKHKCPTSPPWTNSSFLSILIHPLPCLHLSQPRYLSPKSIHSSPLTPVIVYCGSSP